MAFREIYLLGSCAAVHQANYISTEAFICESSSIHRRHNHRGNVDSKCSCRNAPELCSCRILCHRNVRSLCDHGIENRIAPHKTHNKAATCCNVHPCRSRNMIHHSLRKTKTQIYIRCIRSLDSFRIAKRTLGRLDPPGFRNLESNSQLHCDPYSLVQEIVSFPRRFPAKS